MQDLKKSGANLYRKSVSKNVLKGEISAGDSIPIDAENGEISFKRLIH